MWAIYHLSKKVYSFVALNRTKERCTEENCGYNPPEIINDEQIKILNGFTLSDLKYRLLVFIIVFISVLQFGLLYKTWLVRDVKSYIGFNNTKMDNIVLSLVNSYWDVSRTALGVTNHPVFSNEIHFDRYNHIIAIVYLDKSKKEQWLPIIDKNGQPDLYIYGPNWVNWTFRVNQLDVNDDILNKGIEKYTAFWACKNGIDLNDATFLIKVKKIDTPKGWEKDFLNKQIAKPWVEGGFVKWKDLQFSSQIKDIESL